MARRGDRRTYLRSRGDPIGGAGGRDRAWASERVARKCVFAWERARERVCARARAGMWVRVGVGVYARACVCLQAGSYGPKHTALSGTGRGGADGQ
jgi:hypothetical protein